MMKTLAFVTAILAALLIGYLLRPPLFTLQSAGHAVWRMNTRTGTVSACTPLWNEGTVVCVWEHPLEAGRYLIVPNLPN